MNNRIHCPDCQRDHVASKAEYLATGKLHIPCPGLPAPSLRVLPPRPPNVAALLDEPDFADLFAEQAEELAECQALPWADYWPNRDGRHWRTRAIMAEDRLKKPPEVEGVMEALFSHRAAKVHLQSLGDPVSPVLDFAERIKSCRNVMDAWDRVEQALDALDALAHVTALEQAGDAMANSADCVGLHNRNEVKHWRQVRGERP